MKTLSFFIILLFASCFAFSQKIAQVEFSGLRKTKEDYLRQFVTIISGEPLDSARLFENKQRLANLEMLADVTYTVQLDDSGYLITFQCEEVATLLPIFSFGGIEENFWIQAGATEVNMGGRGNKLTSYYQYYDRSSFAAHLILDRLPQSNWGATMDVVKWSTLEPLYFANDEVEYEYDNYTLGMGAIRHFNFTDRLQFGVSVFSENYRKTTAGFFEGAPEKVKKYKLLGKFMLRHNRVNHHYFYLNGWHNQLNIQSIRSFGDDPNFHIVFNDLKFFKRLGPFGNMAARLRLGLSTNQESPFAPFVLDSYVNIRGVGNRVDRGTGAIIVNAEYRHAFMDKNKVALQGVIFSDSGSWRNPGGNLSDFTDAENFVLFAGTGIRIIHKKIYNAVFRIDYGFNLQDPATRGFVLGVGQYF